MFARIPQCDVPSDTGVLNTLSQGVLVQFHNHTLHLLLDECIDVFLKVGIKRRNHIAEVQPFLLDLFIFDLADVPCEAFDTIDANVTVLEKAQNVERTYFKNLLLELAAELGPGDQDGENKLLVQVAKLEELLLVNQQGTDVVNHEQNLSANAAFRQADEETQKSLL